MYALDSFLSLNLTEVSTKIKQGEISPVDIVTALINRIDTVDSKLNSYITVNREGALATAKEREKEVLEGKYRGPLHGIPIGLKDLINTKGLKTTCGSSIFENHIPDENAELVNRLEEAGAIIIGKNNTHQFAYGPTGDRSHVGPVRNPYNIKKMTGGSSSGSAASVAACLNYGTIGTDTGGSVRIPASFCGVVGMKPTYGRVSKRGIYPLSWTLDHAGPLTRSIMDNALVLNAISGYDPLDPDSKETDQEDFSRYIGLGIEGKVIGIPKSYYYENLDPEIEQSIYQAIDCFKRLGASIVEVDIPSMEEISEAQKVILKSEAYAVHENNLKEFPELWDEEVKERLLTGLNVSGSDFAKALRVQKIAKQEFANVLDSVDVLLTPTMSILPPDVNARFLSDDYDDSQHIRWQILKLTAPTDLNGFPSLTLPSGFSKEGLPIGVQLIGMEFEEAKLYQFGYAIEQELSLNLNRVEIE
ncbi:amidase [Salinibacillus xinjiangensis]|nr:amidase [Salinibacillus xinjiangensis]